MPGTTSNFSWPFPVGADAPPDVASDMQSLASAIDASLGNAWTTTYTPVWSSSGTQPTVVDGTIVGRAKTLGKTGLFRGQLTLGAGSTVGTGSYRFSLPASWTLLDNNGLEGAGSFRDLSTGIFHAGLLLSVALGPPATITIRPDQSTTEISATSPVVPANGDVYRFWGVVELA